MNWFDEVFLPNLFEQIGTNNKKWLTIKQTTICLQNMERHVVLYDQDGYGDRKYKSYYFTYSWNDREVELNYSKKNSCGCISFSYNSEERKEAEERQKEELIQQKMQSIERMYKRRNDRYQKTKADFQKELQYHQDELKYWTSEEPLQDGFTKKDCQEEVEYAIKNINFYEKELQFYIY